MNKNYYLLKDILLGLRKELLKCDEELKKLEQYISYDTKKVKNVEFDINYDKQLYCRLVLRRSYLRSIMESLTGKGFSGSECILDKNGNYTFSRDAFGLKINADNLEDFNNQASLILNSEFANEMDSSKLINTQAQNGKKLKINIGNSMLTFANEKLSLSYNAKNDLLTYLSQSNKNLSERLHNSLNLEISKTNFTPYEQEIIENSADINKEVRIVDEITDRNTELQIFEDEKEFVLRKVMK